MTTKFYTPDEVADLLGCSTKTLANWRYQRSKRGEERGPEFRKIEGLVRYTGEALERWLKREEARQEAA